MSNDWWAVIAEGAMFVGYVILVAIGLWLERRRS